MTRHLTWKHKTSSCQVQAQISIPICIFAAKWHFLWWIKVRPLVINLSCFVWLTFALRNLLISTLFVFFSKVHKAFLGIFLLRSFPHQQSGWEKKQSFSKISLTKKKEKQNLGNCIYIKGQLFLLRRKKRVRHDIPVDLSSGIGIKLWIL